MSLCFLLSCRAGILLAFVMAVVVSATPSAAASAAEPAAARTLRHVVLFKFKDSSTPADVARIVEAFRGLPQRIPVIKDPRRSRVLLAFNTFTAHATSCNSRYGV